MDELIILRAPLITDGAGPREGDLALVVDQRPGKQRPGSAVVADVGEYAVLRARYPYAGLREAAAITTRFANAHTHLDLSTYPRIQGEFTRFVQSMTEHRRADPQARGLPAAQQGLRELEQQRASAVGDIVAREPVMHSAMTDCVMPGVAFWEVVCTHQDQAAGALRWLRGKLGEWQRLRERDGPRAGPQVGLSPHSPWLVCRDVLRELARWSIAERIPLQIHVAESAAEAEFFRSGTGALADLFGTLGWARPPSPQSLGFRPDALLSPVRYLAEIGFLDAAPTLVHAVHVDDEDIRIIAQHGCTVVTCPRSNFHLSCGTFRWQAFERAGVPIALATDSAATAHDLSLMGELQAARALLGQGPDAPGLARLTDWLTRGALLALGMQAPLIRPGSDAADLSVLAAGR